jgi:hypothetical protein
VRIDIFKDSFPVGYLGVLGWSFPAFCGALVPVGPEATHLRPVFGERLLLLAQCYFIIKLLRVLLACAADAFACVLQNLLLLLCLVPRFIECRECVRPVCSVPWLRTTTLNWYCLFCLMSAGRYLGLGMWFGAPQADFFTPRLQACGPDLVWYRCLSWSGFG